jgi:hypothetical protein
LSLLDRVKLDKVLIRRSCETPGFWSIGKRRDLSSSNSSPLSFSKEPAAAITCSAVPRTPDISQRLLSDIAQVDWFKTSPSKGFLPNKAEYDLSQDGYPFPSEESRIAKSIDLIFEEGRVAGPKPLYLFPVPLLE